MMFRYKMTEEKFCLSLCKYNNANEADAYTPCLLLHKKLILTAILLKISQINLKIMYIQTIGKKHFYQNYPKDPFCVTRLIYDLTSHIAEADNTCNTCLSLVLKDLQLFLPNAEDLKCSHTGTCH